MLLAVTAALLCLPTPTFAGNLYVFIVFYLSCIAMTWWYYARRQAEMPC